MRPRKDHRGVHLISDVLPFGRLWYGEPNAITNAIRYAKFYSRSHDAVIRVYDDAGKVIETHEQAGDFKEGWDSASQMPNNSAQFAPCSLLIAFPSEGQEIDCKMPSNYS